jgi:phosphoribosyl 1,2-cyclic phosphate phosphodiesterase
MAQLQGLDVLIIDALRWRPHVTHFCVEEAITLAEQLKPKRTIFTHICHELGHAETNSRLPPGLEMGYDGQRIPLT